MLLVATAVLYLWNLSASGWANAFYTAAAQAGASNWTAMLFGSSDAANAITVDKTPAALWVIDLSVRLFGLNQWSVLVPQALEGVAAVALLYAAVRRVAGPGAGLLAGAVLAVTPVAALIFRFNNPDALLVLLLVAAAYCVQRACEKDASRWWLVAAGAAVGFGFLAKMLQAFLVLPGFAAAYAVAGHRPLKRRLGDLLIAGAAVVVSGGWYLALVELWPASSRPYIGGSQHNSIIELTLGYNGLGRLTGNETGGLGNLNHDVGWDRLFGGGMGSDIAWLLPAAVICAVAGVILVRRAPRTDPARAALIVWGGWLAVTVVVFSFANGIVHSYYTVALAPAIGACLGIGATLLWQNRFGIRSAAALSGAVLVTSILAAELLSRHAQWMPWLRASVAVGGAAAAALLLVSGRLAPTVARSVAALAIVVVSGRARGLFDRDRGIDAHWRDTERRTDPSRVRWWSGRAAGGSAGLAQARARTVGDIGPRRRRLHLGRGGRRLEQRCGLSAGERRAGDGRRGFQRHRPRTDARGVPELCRHAADPLLHRRSDDDRPRIVERRQP